MATQNPNAPLIVGAVQQGGHTYVAGQEAALAAVLSLANIERLIGKGVLTGDWSGVGAPAPVVGPPPAPPVVPPPALPPATPSRKSKPHPTKKPPTKRGK